MPNFFAPHITSADSISHISDQSMQMIWGRTPMDFQREAIPRLLMMRCAPYTPQALLLVQGTGGGKSAVAQTVACIDCGVTLIIVETLALAADRSKIEKSNRLYGPVLAYQLDSLKRKDLVDQLKKKLERLKKGGTTTIFLYTSPECLLRDPWKNLMITLIDRQLLKLVCIDEIHLFVIFGITFRKEFTAFKNTFFRHLLNNINPRYTYASGLCSDLKVTLLLMTATFDNTMLDILQKMIGIRVLPCNYLWAGRGRMAQRHIRINMSLSFFPMKEVKQVIQIAIPYPSVLISSLSDTGGINKALASTDLGFHCFITVS